MSSVNLEQFTAAAVQILKLDSETRPFVTNKDLVQRFLLTLHAYHSGEPVEIVYYTRGIKSDGTELNISPFQAVKVVDVSDSNKVLDWIPPLMVDPDGVVPKEVAENMDAIMYQYENKEKVFPGSGLNYLRENVIKHVSAKPGLIDKNKKEWDEFFVRWGLEPVYNKNIVDGEVESDDTDFEEEDGELL